MRKSVSLVIGWRYGYLQVLKQINESALMEMRSYLVRAECCGTVTERSERAIRDTERKGRACCQECWCAGTAAVVKLKSAKRGSATSAI